MQTEFQSTANSFRKYCSRRGLTVVFGRHSHFFALLCFALLCSALPTLFYAVLCWLKGQSFEDNNITNSWILYISNIPLQHPFFNNIVGELCGLQMICLGAGHLQRQVRHCLERQSKRRGRSFSALQHDHPAMHRCTRSSFQRRHDPV
jgi:hypothetical protein